MAFNKMFVMLPVMMAARKLDGEDPNIVFLLRCCYGAVQACALLLILFINIKASAAAADKANNVKIYVAPPPQVSLRCAFLKTYVVCGANTIKNAIFSHLIRYSHLPTPTPKHPTKKSSLVLTFFL